MNILRSFIGNIGENYAEKYLKERGFIVIKRQHKEKYVEIDILAEKDGELYVFEVKFVSCETQKCGVSHRNNSTKKVKTLENQEQLVNTIDLSELKDEISVNELVSARKITRMQRFAEYYLNDNPHYMGVFLGIIVVEAVEKTRKPNVLLYWV